MSNIKEEIYYIAKKGDKNLYIWVEFSTDSPVWINGMRPSEFNGKEDILNAIHEANISDSSKGKISITTVKRTIVEEVIEVDDIE